MSMDKFAQRWVYIDELSNYVRVGKESQMEEILESGYDDRFACYVTDETWELDDDAFKKHITETFYN